MVVRAEPWRRQNAKKNDAFELWCWRRFLKVPWTARRSNQSTVREINPEYLLEALMLKLKRQYFGHLMWTADSLEKSLMLGKMEGRKRRGHQRIRSLDGITGGMKWTWTNFRRWWGTGSPSKLQFTGSQRVRPNWNWVTKQQQQPAKTQFHHFPSGDSAILMLIKCSCFYPCAFWWFVFFFKKKAIPFSENSFM